MRINLPAKPSKSKKMGNNQSTNSIWYQKMYYSPRSKKTARSKDATNSNMNVPFDQSSSKGQGQTHSGQTTNKAQK